MPKKFWQFRNQAADSAELLLYGDISDSSWWGDEVTPKTFADELNALGPLTSLTVRINSGGGDVFAAQTIGNLLEQHTAQVTARIDGLCASAATIIACHCDKVVAANDSTYMIHPVRMGIFDFADAVTLQQYIGALNTIRENILNLYTKKTGREKDEVAAWMDATSWWTGEEARVIGAHDQAKVHGLRAVVVLDLSAGHPHHNVGRLGLVGVHIGIITLRYGQVLLVDFQCLAPLLAAKQLTRKQFFQHFNQRVLAKLRGTANVRPRCRRWVISHGGSLLSGSRQYSLNLCLQPLLQVFFHARLNLRPNGVVHGCNTWAAQSYQLFYIAFRISPAWAISFCPGVF